MNSETQDVVLGKRSVGCVECCFRSVFLQGSKQVEFGLVVVGCVVLFMLCCRCVLCINIYVWLQLSVNGLKHVGKYLNKVKITLTYQSKLRKCDKNRIAKVQARARYPGSSYNRSHQGNETPDVPSLPWWPESTTQGAYHRHGGGRGGLLCHTHSRPRAPSRLWQCSEPHFLNTTAQGMAMGAWAHPSWAMAQPQWLPWEHLVAPLLFLECLSVLMSLVCFEKLVLIQKIIYIQ